MTMKNMHRTEQHIFYQNEKCRFACFLNHAIFNQARQYNSGASDKTEALFVFCNIEVN